jgi:hypothetical protein
MKYSQETNLPSSTTFPIFQRSYPHEENCLVFFFTPSGSMLGHGAGQRTGN